MQKTVLNKIIGLWSIFWLCQISFSQAQDPHFSQYYAAPMYINPALAGTTIQNRLGFNYRAQWPKLPGEFVTFQAAFDANIEPARSGLGFTATLDKAGAAGVKSLNINAIYSYNLQLNKEWGLRAGLQIGYGNRTLDYFKLVFGDQLSQTGYTGSPTQEQGLENLNVSYVDLGSGLMLYKDNFWLGVSGFHLNQPNQSIIGQTERLPMKLSMQMGYKIVRFTAMKRDEAQASLSPAIYYSRQGKYQQLDIGANAYLNPLIVGLWWRGVPIQKSQGGALAVVAGIKYQDWQFLYSYDASIGKFAQTTGGAHEISLLVNLVDAQTKKRYKRKRKKSPEFPSMVY